MSRYFGTDGIRGVAGVDLTAQLAFRLGVATGDLISRHDWDKSILIGRDSRLSGPMLEAAMAAGLMSRGINVSILGLASTPAVAFLTKEQGYPLGCVISASHNPIEDNGIKFFDGQGMKVADEIEDEIENLLDAGELKSSTVSGEQVGGSRVVGNLIDIYVRHLAEIAGDKIHDVPIVVDSAFGAASILAPSVFSILGARVIPLNCIADGTRINVNCGATNPAECAARVIQTGSDMGVALDGDADRVILVDETGNIVDGDQILAMFGIYLLEKNELPENTIVGTVLSNRGLEVALGNAGGKLLRSKVGDKFVLRDMLESGARIGGEKSGHLIFLEHQTTGDGILSALLVALLMKETGKKLSELGGRMSRFPQVQLNISVRDKQACLSDSDIQEKINKLTEEMELKNGRLLVRPSGTESLIRVMTEAPDENEARRLAEQAIELFKQYSETGVITEI